MLMRPISLASLITACALALPWSSGAVAEIYKWVDEKGVTNYSGAPPATGKARKIDLQSVSVSVYEAPLPQQMARALDAATRSKIERLESELLAEQQARRARQASAQADSDRLQLAYEQCLRDRRVDCDLVRDGLYATSYYSPYYYATAAVPFVMAGRRIQRPPLAPAIAQQPVFGTAVHFPGGAPRVAGSRGGHRGGLSRQGR